jgi:hypothetical protein
MISGLSCAIPMRGLMRLSLHIGILIIGSNKLSLINLVNPRTIAVIPSFYVKTKYSLYA